MIDAIDVVVPAHDEERELAACIAALRDGGGASRARRDHGAPRDRARHAAATAAATWPSAALRGLPTGAHIVEMRRVRSAGPRAPGHRRGLLARALRGATRHRSGLPPPTPTPASRRDWLALQLAAARRAAPTPSPASSRSTTGASSRRACAARFSRTTRAVPPVTGTCTAPTSASAPVRWRAPAGCRASRWPRTTRWSTAGRVRRAIVRTGDVRVRTSARREARAAGGFGDLLRTLGRADITDEDRRLTEGPAGGLSR